MPRWRPTPEALADGAFLALAFFLPWTIAGMQVGMAGLLAAAAWRIMRDPTAFNSGGRLGLALALFAAWEILATLLNAQSASEASQALKLWKVLLFWALLNAPVGTATRQRGVSLLLGVAALMGFYGVLQYIFDVDHASPLKLTFTPRPDKTWWTASHAQGLFVGAFTLAGQMVLWTGVWLFHRRRMAPVLRGLALAGIACGLFFTFRRSAWIALAFMGLAGMLVSQRRRKWAYVAAVLALVVGVLASSQMARWRVSEIWVTGPSNARWEIWPDAASLIGDHPLTGVGLGQYEKAMEHRRQTEISYAHAHNNFLQIAAEAGLPTLALWIWWLVEAVLLAVRRVRDDPTRLGLALGLLGFGIMGLFNYNWGDAEVWTAMMFVLSLLAATETPRKESPA